MLGYVALHTALISPSGFIPGFARISAYPSTCPNQQSPVAFILQASVYASLVCPAASVCLLWDSATAGNLGSPAPPSCVREHADKHTQSNCIFNKSQTLVGATRRQSLAVSVFRVR